MEILLAIIILALWALCILVAVPPFCVLLSYLARMGGGWYKKYCMWWINKFEKPWW